MKLVFELLQRELSEAIKEKTRAWYVAVGRSPDTLLQSNFFLNIMILVAILALLTSLVAN